MWVERRKDTFTLVDSEQLVHSFYTPSIWEDLYTMRPYDLLLNN
jgi:hypothetical protein